MAGLKNKAIKYFIITLAVILFLVLCDYGLEYDNSEKDTWAKEDINKMTDGKEASEVELYYGEDGAADGEDDLADYGEHAELADMVLPCAQQYATISSGFGKRNVKELAAASKYHKGIDLLTPKGTPINSVLDGVVVKAQYYGNMGNAVFVQHANGVVTKYGHLSKINVKEGDTVSASTVVGLAGSTGASTGAHLHFQIEIDGTAVDPETYFTGLAHR